MSPATGPLQADVLARLLLIQSTAAQLPDTKAVFGFVCRGLEQVPGVASASLDTQGTQAGGVRFPIRHQMRGYGELVVTLSDPDAFSPYSPHVGNLAALLAVVLEERRQRELAESYQRTLEARVLERTRELSAQKQRAEDYLEILARADARNPSPES